MCRPCESLTSFSVMMRSTQTPKVCGIIAFYGCCAIMLPILGGLDEPELALCYCNPKHHLHLWMGLRLFGYLRFSGSDIGFPRDTRLPRRVYQLANSKSKCCHVGKSLRHDDYVSVKWCRPSISIRIVVLQISILELP